METAGCGIRTIYLHRTASRYRQKYNDYHLCIGPDGTVFVNCRHLTDIQIEVMADVVAVFCEETCFPITLETVMTCCEAVFVVRGRCPEQCFLHFLLRMLYND